eukprot:scaffold11437_cov75-Phaeocystis_antarctica.AAC.4
MARIEGDIIVEAPVALVGWRARRHTRSELPMSAATHGARLHRISSNRRCTDVKGLPSPNRPEATRCACASREPLRANATTPALRKSVFLLLRPTFEPK